MIDNNLMITFAFGQYLLTLALCYQGHYTKYDLENFSERRLCMTCVFDVFRQLHQFLNVYLIIYLLLFFMRHSCYFIRFHIPHFSNSHVWFSRY